MSNAPFERALYNLREAHRHIFDTILTNNEKRYRNELVELCKKIVADTDTFYQSEDEGDEENLP